MYVSQEIKTFFTFIIIGILLGLIFDIFRALRKIKRTGRGETYLQDIIYFIIVGVILIISIYKTLYTELRIHIFIALILGVVLYISTISSIIIKFYVRSMETIINFFKFIFLPIVTECEIIVKIVVFLKKSTIKCCKKLNYMVSYIQNKFVKTIEKRKNNKRGIFNGFKRKEKSKKTKYKLD